MPQTQGPYPGTTSPEELMKFLRNVQQNYFYRHNPNYRPNLSEAQIRALTPPGIRPDALSRLFRQGLSVNVSPQGRTAAHAYLRPMSRSFLDILLGRAPGRLTQGSAPTISLNPQLFDPRFPAGTAYGAASGVFGHELIHANDAELSARLASAPNANFYGRRGQQIESRANIAFGGYPELGPGNFRWLDALPPAMRGAYADILRERGKAADKPSTRKPGPPKVSYSGNMSRMTATYTPTKRVSIRPRMSMI